MQRCPPFVNRTSTAVLPIPAWRERGLWLFLAIMPMSFAMLAADASAQDESTDATAAATQSQLMVDTNEAAKSYQQTLEELMEDPVFAEGRNEAQQQFKAAKRKLADVTYKMRSVHMRYRNRDRRTVDDRREYIRLRREAQLAMRETFEASMNFFRFGGDAESVQYLTTMILNHRNADIYDPLTMEAAARLLDGGQREAYLFEAAARSAVSHGNFDLAKRLYEAIAQEDLEKTDQLFAGLMDKFAEEYEQEMKMRQRDSEKSLPQIRFDTTQGSFTIELFIDDAPSTSSHLIGLVENGFYDGLDFTQVIDELLALTGDPSSSGSGNSGQFLMDEAQGEDAPRRALRGSVLMAKLPTKDGKFIPNSASSQIAILFLPKILVHENQTVVGRVVDGMDVVSRLRRIDPSKEKKKGEVEVAPDQILKAEVVSRPDDLPTPNYLAIPGRTG